MQDVVRANNVINWSQKTNKITPELADNPLPSTMARSGVGDLMHVIYTALDLINSFIAAILL